MAFETKDTLNPRKVIEFVMAAHHDLEAMEKLLEEDPRLVNASMDVGNGDWESGLDAAAHMGRKDIAEVLIDNGARLDFLYLMAMLDEVDLVKAILARFPSAKDTPGVHGFSLRQFAERGKAKQVLAYLDSLDEAN